VISALLELLKKRRHEFLSRPLRHDARLFVVVASGDHLSDGGGGVVSNGISVHIVRIPPRLSLLQGQLRNTHKQLQKPITKGQWYHALAC
jgi:hypothetical protein